jgi:hypothetical protein
MFDTTVLILEDPQECSCDPTGAGEACPVCKAINTEEIPYA